MSLLPTALIVDDDPIIVEALAAALESHFEVQFALTAGEAMPRLLAKPQPDIILLDVMLPDMNGFELCAQLQQSAETKAIPIIFVTSLSTPSEEARGLELGAVDFISKPISPAIVRARVRNHFEIKRTREQLERLTLTDGLTNLANRRHFDSALTQEIERTKRSGEPLSLVLIDVDNFKMFNDSYGHPRGDSCLQAIARVLHEHAARQLDLAARVGGEEFACLLPGTDLDGARLVGERLRSGVQALDIAHAANASTAVITVSCGCASTSANLSPQMLYEAADAALYRAKAAGRNRVL